MATLISSLQPTTELEAVNAMLGVIGEASLPTGANLATTYDSNVDMAIRLLKEVTREVQSRGWRFNSEYGVEVAPTNTYTWVDTQGNSTLLNIFKRPSGLLKWAPSATFKHGTLDLVERPSKKYTEGGLSVLVLYDRTRSRDGAEKARHPYVYLDTVTAFDFEQMPETARRYVTVAAARLLAEQSTGSDLLASFTRQDEQMALQLLMNDQGEAAEFTIMDSVGAAGALGGRPWRDGAVSKRVFPGSV